MYRQTRYATTPPGCRREVGLSSATPWRGRGAMMGRYTSVTASRMTDAYGASTPEGCTADLRCPALSGSVGMVALDLRCPTRPTCPTRPIRQRDPYDRDVLSLFPLFIIFIIYLIDRLYSSRAACFSLFVVFFVADLTSDAPLSGLVLFFWSAFCIKCQQGYYSELSEMLILTFSRNTLYKRDSRLLSYLIFL